MPACYHAADASRLGHATLISLAGMNRRRDAADATDATDAADAAAAVVHLMRFPLIAVDGHGNLISSTQFR